jgi:hypothetical protein
VARSNAPRAIAQTVSDHRLLAVLLTDALHTVASGSRRLGLLEARRWICARDSDDPYSFERACEVLGLPAPALRRRLGLRAEMPRRASRRGTLRGSNS